MFVYSCNNNNKNIPCFRICWTLGKHFLPPAGCGSIFPAKSSWDARRSGSWLVRGQVNMVDEAKLPSSSSFRFRSIGCATRGWTIVLWRIVRPFLLTNASCRHWGFQCFLSICCILAWRWSLFTKEPGGLHFMGFQRVGHECTTSTFTFIELLSILLRYNGFAQDSESCSGQEETTKQWP